MYNTIRHHIIKGIPANVVAWIVWKIAVIYYLYEYIQRISPAVMVGDIMQSLKINAAQMGNLSAMYFYTYGLMQIPVGILIDKYGPKRPLVWGCLLLSIGSFGFSYAHTPFIAYLCRGLVGLGSAFGYLACLKIVVNWFCPKRFGFMCGLVNMIGMVGAFFGAVILSTLMNDLAWRELIFELSLFSLGILILLIVVVKDHPHKQRKIISHTKVAPKPPLFKRLWMICKSKQVLLAALYVGLTYCTFDAIAALWGVPFVEKTYHVSHIHAASISSLIFLGAIFGYPCFGALTTYLKHRHKLLMISNSLIMTCIAIGIWLAPHSIMLVATLFFSLGFFAGITATATTLGKESMPLHISGLTMSVINTALVLLGAASQPLFGYLLDLHHKQTVALNALTGADFHRAFVIMPISFFISLLCALLVKQPHQQKT